MVFEWKVTVGIAGTVFCASSCVSFATEARCSCCLASIRCCFSSSLASTLAFLCQTSDSATTRTPNRLLCLSLLLVSLLNLYSLLPEKSDGASAPFLCILLHNCRSLGWFCLCLLFCCCFAALFCCCSAVVLLAYDFFSHFARLNRPGMYSFLVAARGARCSVRPE